MKKLIALLLGTLLLAGCAAAPADSLPSQSPQTDSVPLCVASSLPEGARIENVFGYAMPVRDGSLEIELPCVIDTALIRDNRPLSEDDKASLKVYFPLLSQTELDAMTKSDLAVQMDRVELTQNDIAVLQNQPDSPWQDVDLTGWTWGDVKARNAQTEAQRLAALENPLADLGITAEDYRDLAWQLREQNLTGGQLAALGKDVLREKLEELYRSRISYVLRFTYQLDDESAAAILANNPA